VPTEDSPGARDNREHYERLRRELNEDPARFLDCDLFDHGQVRLEPRENPEWNESNQRAVRDDDVSAPGEMMRDRIRGIDSIAVARAWRAVERGLDRTPEGGRDIIIDFIETRIAELEEHGERELPGLSPEEQRERGVEAHESVAPKPDAVYLDEDGQEQNIVTADEKLAAMADGGEEQ